MGTHSSNRKIKTIIATVVKGELFRGLKDVIKELGHDKLETIAIFKIYCEGCARVEDLHRLDGSIHSQSAKNLVETHYQQAPEKHALAFFDGLKDAGYTTFHMEPNLLHTSQVQQGAGTRFESSKVLRQVQHGFESSKSSAKSAKSKVRTRRLSPDNANASEEKEVQVLDTNNE